MKLTHYKTTTKTHKHLATNQHLATEKTNYNIIRFTRKHPHITKQLLALQDVQHIQQTKKYMLIICRSMYSIQVSYGASSPILSNRGRFKKFFRLSAPDTNMNPARIDLLRNFNWKKMATIHEAQEFFSVVFLAFSIMFCEWFLCCRVKYHRTEQNRTDFITRKLYSFL